VNCSGKNYRNGGRSLIKCVFEYSIYNPGFTAQISGFESADRAIDYAFGDNDRNAVVNGLARVAPLVCHSSFHTITVKCKLSGNN